MQDKHLRLNHRQLCFTWLPCFGLRLKCGRYVVLDCKMKFPMKLNKHFILFCILLAIFFHTNIKAQDNSPNPKTFIINIKVNYPASLFTIVDNLSKWSEYCDESTYEYWSKYYSITKRQSSFLYKYSRIRKKYGWGELEPCFLENSSLDKALFCLSSKVEPIEMKLIKKTLYAFKTNFDSLWDKRNYLPEQKEKIESRLRELNVSELLTKIIRLYNVKGPPDSFKVCLLFNPTPNNSDGGANSGIFIRNGYNISVDENIMIMLHEITHFFSDSLNKLLFKIAEQQGIRDNHDKTILHESLDYTLFPAYYYKIFLGKKYSLKIEANKMKEKDRYLYSIFNFADKIYPYIKDAINNNKSLDSKLILKLVKLYKQNKTIKVINN